jgi:hypothetical protein
MPAPRTLWLYQLNDELLNVAVFEDTDPPYTTAEDLTGMTEVTLVIKATRETADAEGAELTLTDGAIAITNALLGLMQITVPAASLAIAGRRWYRLDAVRAGKTRTLAYGYLVVTDT